VAAAGAAPDHALVSALAVGTTASDVVAEGHSGPDDLAVARFAGRDAVLLVGREGPPFRLRERIQLRALTRIADRMWHLLPTP